jgi:hypothetical protein
VGAGLFLRTLENAYSVELGYQVDQTLVASLNLETRGYFEGGSRGPDAGLAVYEQILSRVEALPSVVAAGAARMTVLSGAARSTAVSTDGRPLERDNSNALGVRANVVSHRYFETMNIPILRGRPFNTSDSSTTPRVTIVTKSLADRVWPNEDPIGTTLRDETRQLAEVRGIAARKAARIRELVANQSPADSATAETLLREKRLRIRELKLLRKRVDALRRAGAIAWSGRQLQPAKSAGKVRGNKTVAHLVVENRD